MVVTSPQPLSGGKLTAETEDTPGSADRLRMACRSKRSRSPRVEKRHSGSHTRNASTLVVFKPGSVASNRAALLPNRMAQKSNAVLNPTSATTNAKRSLRSDETTKPTERRESNTLDRNA